MSPVMASAPAASAVASVDSERATAATAQPSARRPSMTARPRLRAPKTTRAALLLLRVVHRMQHDGRGSRARASMPRAPRADIAAVSVLPSQTPASSRAWWPATSTSSPWSLGIDGGGDRARRPRRARCPPAPARLTFNAPSAACCSPARCGRRARDALPGPTPRALSYAQRREAFRVTVGPAARPSSGRPALGGVHDAEPVDRRRAARDRGAVRASVRADGRDRLRRAEPVRLAATPIRSERQATRHAVAFANVGGADERTLSTLIAAAQRRRWPPVTIADRGRSHARRACMRPDRHRLRLAWQATRRPAVARCCARRA